jgi:GH35 family endo-1,4-beta-xylanase
MKKLLSARPLVACIARTLICSAICVTANAQLSTNPDKFLGNITTSYQMDAGGGVPQFYKLWNQVTCENESKWGSVEGTRGSYNWSGADNAFKYAKNHNFTYKFHALVWGSQYPNWLPNLSPTDRFAAMEKWFDAVKNHYKAPQWPNTLPMIDVVNEAVGTHQAGNPMIKESLGGGGKTGYDWLIKAFEMAYERFPNSILIYNDFNTFQWNTDEYIDLVRYLRDAGAPIDAYGCQSHDLTDCSLSKFQTAEKKIQDALKMPMYSTEYDIGTADDNLQLQRYKEQIPYMWEKDYCAGITLWGYVYGKTWTTDGNSGIYKNGKERPAMTWLKEYMASEKAQQAKSPFPGMKKRVGVYVRPRDLKVAKGDVLPIKVRTFITDDAKAENAAIAIEKVELYVSKDDKFANATELISTMTEEPYIAEYSVPSNSTTGWKATKAIVYTNDGNTYERYGRINVLSSTVKREPYSETLPELPGRIITGKYDNGASGVTYNKASRSIGTAGATVQTDGWMEYTVDVKEPGIYTFDASVSATKAGGMFHISEYTLDNLTYFSDFIEVPSTGSTSSNKQFRTLHGVFKKELTAGRHTLCLNIDKGGFYINEINFKRYDEDKTMTCTVSRSPAAVTVGEKTTITVTAASKTSDVVSVDVYANNLWIGTLTEAPYKLEYEPTSAGKHSITAVVTDANGKSKTSTVATLTVNPQRTPYSGVISIPGTIQAENYDKGGEGYSYHDSDTNNEGDASFRTDEGIDIVKGNNGKAIGYTANGEWTEYTINVKEPGEYEYTATVSNGSSSTGGFTIGILKGTSTTATTVAKVSFSGTGGWDTYKTVTGKLTQKLAVGEQRIRFTINPGNCNIDKVEFKCTLNTGIEEVNSVNAETGEQFSLSGQKVGANYRGIVIKNGRKVLKK